LQWGFDGTACPFCRNHDRARLSSFATADGQYRVFGCDQCRRYLKAFDARHASRPVFPTFDNVATLPLDAAAIQRGYLAG
jgi:FdhE protein